MSELKTSGNMSGIFLIYHCQADSRETAGQSAVLPDSYESASVHSADMHAG